MDPDVTLSILSMLSQLAIKLIHYPMLTFLLPEISSHLIHCNPLLSKAVNALIPLRCVILHAFLSSADLF